MNAAVEEALTDPRDETLTTCLIFEPPVKTAAGKRKGNISHSGLHFIATHQYRSGDYTHLDNFLNPMWTYLTELLPMWLAPNMVNIFRLLWTFGSALVSLNDITNLDHRSYPYEICHCFCPPSR